MKFITKLFFLMALIVSTRAFALSPPWYLFQAQVKATLERDSCVRVEELKEVSDHQYDLDLHVCRQTKAIALASFMDRTKQIGNIGVKIRVYYRNTLIHGTSVPSSTQKARTLVSRALSGNQSYLGTLPGNSLSKFFIKFSKSVVQYFGDDISDAYGNINQVAAEAFRQVLGLEDVHNIAIGTTTARTRSLEKIFEE